MFCATLFQGKGYDEAFTACMTETLKALEQGEPIRLCQGSDHLCGACPHRMEGDGCALSTEDVLHRDAAAFAAVGLEKDSVTDWNQIRRRLAQVDEKQWQKVCGGCRWQIEGLCSWEMFRQRVKTPFV